MKGTFKVFSLEIIMDKFSSFVCDVWWALRNF